MVPCGHFRHPIIPKDRIRYESELDDYKSTAKMSYVKDCFSEHPLLIGVIIYKKINVNSVYVFVTMFSLVIYLVMKQWK